MSNSGANLVTRRSFTTALAAASLATATAAPKLNSRIAGVRIGVITYSFRALPSSAEEVLKYCQECGIGEIELMNNVAESYAGAPLPQMGPGFFRPGPRSPEQIEAMKKSAAAVKEWRLAASMDKFKAFRKMYEAAGVKIYAFKLPPTLQMSDQEYAYIWKVAETLGADHITMELPTDDALLQRVADFAASRKLRIAFHTHGQGGASGFEKALNASKYTALNLDVGHYFGVNGESPVPVIEKYHDRIASLHLKDRQGPSNGKGGGNMPWGQGATPLKEILQLMKKRGYKFPATIEYEYDTPAGSDVLAEVKKCVAYCKSALA